MKLKFFLTSAVAIMIFILTGCGGNEQANSAEKNFAEGEMKNKKILIAYYSLTGTTKKAAEKISAEVGGEIFEIKAAEPYPIEHDPCLERDMKEIEENLRPKVANKVENFEQYEIIFVGYPIWYYQAPMLINTFLEEYNFSGKKIIPFCTSGGYPIENSIEILKNSAPNANFVEGLRIDDDDEMKNWLKRLGF